MLNACISCCFRASWTRCARGWATTATTRATTATRRVRQRLSTLRSAARTRTSAGPPRRPWPQSMPTTSHRSKSPPPPLLEQMNVMGSACVTNFRNSCVQLLCSYFDMCWLPPMLSHGKIKLLKSSCSFTFQTLFFPVLLFENLSVRNIWRL